MTISELFRHLKDKGYDNRHAEYYFLCVVNDEVRTQSGHGKKWHEDKLLKELEYDRRRVFQLWYGPGEWMQPFRTAHDEMVSMVWDFAIDFLLANP